MAARAGAGRTTRREPAGTRSGAEARKPPRRDVVLGEWCSGNADQEVTAQDTVGHVQVPFVMIVIPQLLPLPLGVASST